MTYLSLPLSFMHPNSIVMHPPKPAALSGLPFTYDDLLESYPQSIAPASRAPKASYVITASGESMLDRVALNTWEQETIVYMHSEFDASGEIHYTLTDANGRVVLEKTETLATGAGSSGIEMSHLTPGAYKLMVSWLEDEEESAVMYQIEKLL